MFVLFLCVVLLRISICRTTENNNTSLKDHLQKSLTHVHDMLADIEGKIERERRILSQIDYDLNFNGSPGFLDYDVTDIWWQTSHTPAEPTKPGDTTIEESPTISNVVEPVPVPAATPVTPEDQYAKEMKRNMVLYSQGYGTAGIAKLMELLFTKERDDATALIVALAIEGNRTLQNGTFTKLGGIYAERIQYLIAYMYFVPTPEFQEHAKIAHHYLMHKKGLMTKDMNDFADYYDGLFTDEEGVDFFKALSSIDRYPDGEKGANEACQELLRTFLAPFTRITDTRSVQKLIWHLNQAVQDLSPDWRFLRDNIHTEASDNKTGAEGHIFSGVPERRSLRHKHHFKYFHLKHPKSSKQYKTGKHILNRKKKELKKHRHHKYRKNHEKHHQRHKRLHKHKKIRQRAALASLRSKEAVHQATELDTSASGAFYHEPFQQHKFTTIFQRNHKRKLHQLQRKKTKLRKLKDRRFRKAKQRRRKDLYGTIATTTSLHIFKQQFRTDSFRTTTQGSQNFRRFAIPSSEGKKSNNSNYFEVSVENNTLHIIRETSSYSDQEDHLKNNLYDALRHSNGTYVNFRRGESTENNHHNQFLKYSSSETDDEWLLKNNIYKVFERKKDHKR